MEPDNKTRAGTASKDQWKNETGYVTLKISNGGQGEGECNSEIASYL